MGCLQWLSDSGTAFAYSPSWLQPAHDAQGLCCVAILDDEAVAELRQLLVFVDTGLWVVRAALSGAHSACAHTHVRTYAAGLVCLVAAWLDGLVVVLLCNNTKPCSGKRCVGAE
jgi:hypothetical protein